MGTSSNSKNSLTPPTDMKLSEIKNLVKKTPWVAPGEAATFLDVSRQRVTELMNEGKLEVITYHGARHVLLTSIIKRLEMPRKNPKNSCRDLQ